MDDDDQSSVVKSSWHLDLDKELYFTLEFTTDSIIKILCPISDAPFGSHSFVRIITYLLKLQGCKMQYMVDFLWPSVLQY